MQRREFIKKAGGLFACGALGMRERASAQLVQPATGPLKVHPKNPRYFTDGSGRAIFLTGSHTWTNLQDNGIPPIPTFDWPGYIAMMKSHNHNFMRLWGWQQSAWAPWTPDKIVYEPTLYVRTGPGMALDGGLKFDLKKFNPVYFDRMRARVTECRERGIYCAVQLFQGFSYNRPNHCGKQTWSGHPYNSQNNINGVNGDRNGDGQPDLDDAQVREQHAAYLKKIVDTVNDLDNVLYEVVNEGGGKDWDWWVVDTVHKLEAEKGKRHPVGLTGAGVETMEEMMASPAEWISPFGRQFLFDPPSWDGKKVSVNDTDHLWGHGGTVTWAWKSFARGHNTLLMDAWDPIAGAPCPEVNWGPRPGYPLRDLNRRDDFDLGARAPRPGIHPAIREPHGPGFHGAERRSGHDGLLSGQSRARVSGLSARRRSGDCGLVARLGHARGRVDASGRGDNHLRRDGCRRREAGVLQCRLSGPAVLYIKKEGA